MLDANVRRERRLAQHAILDVEAATYNRERQTVPRDRQVETPLKEARRVVGLRYTSSTAHELYMSSRHGFTNSTPSCQKDCDSCHRISAINRIRELCATRDEFIPLLNWILEPDFLA